MPEIIMIEKDFRGPLYHNTPNQLRRAIGRYTTVYDGGCECGTVRDANGQCWDWRVTSEVLDDFFCKIQIEKSY